MSGQPVGFPQLLQDFFLRRLIDQRGASARTVESYRDAFTLLLRYTEHATGTPAACLSIADLDAPLILDLLDHLEADRGNTARTRNARLAAIHSFMRYASLRDPLALPVASRVLAIPAKRFDRPLLGYLTRDEVAAILAAPDPATWSGRRDRVMLATLYNTGARVSEITALRAGDVLTEPRHAVQLHGKGRKQRAIPLWPATARQLRDWITDNDLPPAAPAFANRGGRPMTRSGVADRLARAVTAAAGACPTLRGQPVSPHTLRHSTAMHLLQAGTDITVIALWLGHADPATTHQYLAADMATKQAALERLASRHHAGTVSRRRRAPRVPRPTLTMRSTRAREPPPHKAIPTREQQHCA